MKDKMRYEEIPPLIKMSLLREWIISWGNDLGYSLTESDIDKIYYENINDIDSIFYWKVESIVKNYMN